MQKHLFSLFWVFFSIASLAMESSPPWDKLETSFIETLGKFVAADTTNPPGNEARIVKLVAERLKKEGIEFEETEFAPGRKNIVARLSANKKGSEKGVMLLAHLDVVGSKDQKWTTSDPHQMEEKNGYLLGRGVADDLGMAAIALEVFSEIKRKNIPLRRDIILALTGDEEVEGRGIQYLLEHKFESVNADIVLNEGGGPILDEEGKPHFVALEVAEKTYQDFDVVATGSTGHSSIPLDDNAIYHLAKALDKIEKLRFAPSLTDLTRAYLLKRAAFEPEPLKTAMREIANAKKSLPKKALEEVNKHPALRVHLYTACVATVISGGSAHNSLPAQAKANVNCRILPWESREEILSQLNKVIGDKAVSVSFAGGSYASKSSPLLGEGPKAIEKIMSKKWPGIPLIPYLAEGASDSLFFRNKGIAAYGFNPIAMSEADGSRMHGIDERISMASIKPALELTYELMLELAGEKTTLAP